MASGGRRLLETSSVVAAILSFYALFNTGIFNRLNQFVYHDRTIPQLIFMSMVAIGFGIIAVNLFSGAITLKDAYKDATDFVEDISQYESQSQGSPIKEIPDQKCF